MAVLKNRQIGKTVALVIAVVMLLAVAIPLVSAFEAHSINVRCYVKERFNLIKVARLATATDWEGMGIVFPSDPNPWDPLNPPPWNEVPMNTCVVWVVTINICNPHDYMMTNVWVYDNFSAELNGEAMPDNPVDAVIKRTTRGRAKKTIEPQQIRIEWEVGELLPIDGEIQDCASLEILVWTKLNPGSWQEYTSPGCYTLNSGPTAKWLDDTDHQVSLDGEPLYVKTTGWQGACGPE